MKPLCWKPIIVGIKPGTITRLAAILLLAAFVTACASVPQGATLYTTCQSIKRSANALRPFEPRMTTEQVQSFVTLLRSSAVVCTTPAGEVEDLTDVTNLARTYLRRLVVMQQEIEQ